MSWDLIDSLLTSNASLADFLEELNLPQSFDAEAPDDSGGSQPQNMIVSAGNATNDGFDPVDVPEPEMVPGIVKLLDAGENASKNALVAVNAASDTSENVTNTRTLEIPICLPGQFVYFAGNPTIAICMPCRPGTYSNQSSSILHACPDTCKPGYTTKYGAVHNDDCEPSYILMEGRNCSGATDTNGDGWANHGYQYVTSAAECEAAAHELYEQANLEITREDLAITERCTDTNLQTKVSDEQATTDLCKVMKHFQGDACIEGSALFTNADIAVGGKDLVSMDCSKTCSACGTDDGTFCRQGKAPDAAPIGVCILETNGDGSQRLSFYDSCSAAYFDGNDYKAICKVLECSPQEQVQGDGSTSPAENVLKNALTIGRPWFLNAVCEPNAAQYAAWCRAREHRYLVYYIVNFVVVVAVYLYLFYHWAKRSKDVDDDDDVLRGKQSKRQYDGPPKSALRLWWRSWKTPRNEFWLATYFIFKVIDALSDWAFFAIAITVGAFAHLATHSCNSNGFCSIFLFGADGGFDVALYRLVCLAVTVVGTLLIGFDLSSLYRRHQYAAELSKWKEEVAKVKMDKVGTVVNNFDLPPEPQRPRQLTLVPATVIICEDVPQLFLTGIYLSVVGFAECNNGSGIAKASLGLSFLGLLVNLWFAFETKMRPWLDKHANKLDTRWMLFWYGGTYYEIMFHHGKITQDTAEERLVGDKTKVSQKAKFLVWSNDAGATIVSFKYPRDDLGFDEVDPQDHNVITKAKGKWHNKGSVIDTSGRKHSELALADVINIVLNNMAFKIKKQVFPVRDTSLPEDGFQTYDEKVVWMIEQHKVSRKEAKEFLEVSNLSGYGQYMGTKMEDAKDTEEYLDIVNEDRTYLEIASADDQHQYKRDMYIQIHEPEEETKQMPKVIVDQFSGFEGPEYDYLMYQTIRYTDDDTGGNKTSAGGDMLSIMEQIYKQQRRAKVQETSFNAPTQQNNNNRDEDDAEYLKIGESAADNHFFGPGPSKSMNPSDVGYLNIEDQIDPNEDSDQYLDVQPHAQGQGQDQSNHGDGDDDGNGDAGSDTAAKYETKSLFVNAMQKPRRASEKRNVHVRRDFAKLDNDTATDEPVELTIAETSFSSSMRHHDHRNDRGRGNIDDDASSLGSGFGFGTDVSSSDWDSSDESDDSYGGSSSLKMCKMCTSAISMASTRFCAPCNLVYYETMLLSAAVGRDAEREMVDNWWPVAFLKSPADCTDVDVEMLKKLGAEAKVQQGAGASIGDGSTVRKPVATPKYGWDDGDPEYTVIRSVNDCNDMAFNPDALTLWRGDKVVVHLIQGNKAWGTCAKPLTKEEKMQEKQNRALERKRLIMQKQRATYFSHKMLPVVGDLTTQRAEHREEYDVDLTKGRVNRKPDKDIQKKRWRKYSFNNNPAEFYTSEVNAEADC